MRFSMSGLIQYFTRGEMPGPRLGAGMKRGTIVAAGGADELPPSFR